MLSLLMPPRADSSVPPRVAELHLVAAELHPVIRAVVAAVLRQGQGHPDVEDCANEAIRRALEGTSRLRDGEPLRPWVIGIARHVALDVLRARKRQRIVQDARDGSDGSEDLPALVERVPDSKPDPLERMESARRQDMVRKAIAGLNENTRTALAKFHLQGKSYQEIAEEMHVPLGTVATWVTRGRKAMAELLDEQARQS
ncbi:MAG TPA: RNA polymerase sigma factor [Polyangiaceae bacterium]|nr:RNA polymerase sigma factor [Polyangiaceae bacterium]